MSRKLKGIVEELATDMRKGLNAQEQQQVERLIAEIPEMERELKALKAAHTKVDGRAGGGRAGGGVAGGGRGAGAGQVACAARFGGCAVICLMYEGEWRGGR